MRTPLPLSCGFPQGAAGHALRASVLCAFEAASPFESQNWMLVTGTWLDDFPIGNGIIIPIDSYFSGGLKPPASTMFDGRNGGLLSFPGFSSGIFIGCWGNRLESTCRVQDGAGSIEVRTKEERMHLKPKSESGSGSDERPRVCVAWPVGCCWLMFLVQLLSSFKIKHCA